MTIRSQFMTDSQILSGLKTCSNDLDLFEGNLFKGNPTDLITRIQLFVKKSYESPFLYAQNSKQIKRLREAVSKLENAPLPKETSDVKTEKKEEAPKTTTTASTSLWSFFSGFFSSSKKTASDDSVPHKKDPSSTPRMFEMRDSKIADFGQLGRVAPRSDRIPVGLYNENGNDCFLNAIRQFMYNTPIVDCVLPKLSARMASKKCIQAIRSDFENYQAQKAGSPMSGSAAVRKELMPSTGQQDAHEAMMQLFNCVPINYNNPKNPLFHDLRHGRTFDLDSLPGNLSYDDFSAESKSSFKIDSQFPRYATHTARDVLGPITIAIKPEHGPVIKTMQGAWNHFANPEFKPTKPPYERDAIGVYLEKSTRLSKETLESGRFFIGDKDQVKIIPDQTSEQVRFHDMPEHLVFSLKRYVFSKDSGGEKISDPIEVDETFRLDHRHVSTGGAADFHIEAFIVQVGSAEYGHYYTYILKNGQWFKCNDSFVDRVSKEDARKAMKRAYIFYAKRLGEVSKSNKEVSSSRVIPPRPLLIPEDRPLEPDYLIDKPTVDPSMLLTGTKGSFRLGTANQNAVVSGRHSCLAQALGFLAKALRGNTVTAEGIKPMLEENARKFRSLREKHQRASGVEEARLDKVARQGVIDFVVKEVEDLAENCQMLNRTGAKSLDIANYKKLICKQTLEKYRMFCLGNSLPVLANKLDDLVDQVIAKKLLTSKLEEEVKKVVIQDKAVDVKRLESTKQLRSNRYSAKTLDFSSVYPHYQSEFRKSFIIPETVVLDADFEMRVATFTSILTLLKEAMTLPPKNAAVGAVMTLNGETYSVALTTQKDGSILYQVYDSQGKAPLTGSDQAFIFQTKNESRAAHFLTKLAPYQPTKLHKDQDQNVLKYYKLFPAAQSMPSKIWEVVITKGLGAGLYNLGYYGLYTTYYGVKAMSWPFVQIGQLLSKSCQKSKPIKSATTEAVNAAKTQLTQMRTRVERFKKSEEAFTENDLSSMGDILHRLQLTIKKDPALQVLEFELSQSLAELYGRLPESTSSKKSEKTTSDFSSYDPKGLIAFYQGGVKNKNGFTLEEIFNFNDSKMEFHHDFIQWLFPMSSTKNRRGNGVNPLAPELNPQLIAAAKKNPVLKANLLKAFDKMLKYYGLKRESGQVVAASNFSAQKKNWLINNAHNLRRMTRIIISLSELGLKAEANAFGNCIVQIAEAKKVVVPAISQKIWKKALHNYT